MGQPGPPSPPTLREPVPGWRPWETGFETLSDPTSNPATWLTCHPATTSTRVASTPLRGPKMPLTAAKPPRLAPHFNRLFRDLMSLRRRSDGPADVIPHVWLCHCGPERTLSKSVHSFTSCRGAIYPCFSYELTPPAILFPNSNSCTPPVLRGRGRKKESL